MAVSHRAPGDDDVAVLSLVDPLQLLPELTGYSPVGTCQTGRKLPPATKHDSMRYDHQQVNNTASAIRTEPSPRYSSFHFISTFSFTTDQQPTSEILLRTSKSSLPEFFQTIIKRRITAYTVPLFYRCYSPHPSATAIKCRRQAVLAQHGSLVPIRHRRGAPA